MGYLNSKKGSLEEIVSKVSKFATESGYQKMFKKALDKAGRGIGAMSPTEKKTFFNKVDKDYKAKKEQSSGTALTGSPKNKVDTKPRIDYNK
tara:strand:- start:1152 stop:1427 length:276 start_codon:yes stop_codon:yes gene_type:complete